MCFSINMENKKAIDKQLGIWSKQNENPLTWTPDRWIKAFDFPELPLLMNDLSLQIVKWGLVPHWVRDEAGMKKIRVQTLNCRSETMYELPSFKNSAEKKRALLPVNGFFEYQHWNKNGELDPEGKVTKPYKITYKGKDTFFLGCLYADREDFKTFTIITTDSNTLMSEIHNAKKRMPVVIREQDVERWLQGGPEEKFKDLFQLRDEIELVAEEAEGPPSVPKKEKPPKPTKDDDIQGLLF